MSYISDNYRLACSMADDLKKRSKRLSVLERSGGRLYDYCRIWVDAYGFYQSEFGGSLTIGEDAHHKEFADRRVKEAMPMWLWILLGQALLKLIWEWWKNRVDMPDPIEGTTF